MSFLNPVNEPVLRFSSTDADAPQINYNARTAGDVKAVLKACLVTGYGAKASAGWSAVNETATVIEFVSPSAAMSDYRLGIDDTSTSSTTWYYQFQNARTNPSNNAPTKSFSYADKTHVDNGWQLLVTARGMIFIELVQHSVVNKLSARITYWGAVKSAISDTAGQNICFFNIGHLGATNPVYKFYTTAMHLSLAVYGDAYVSTTTGNALSSDVSAYDLTSIDISSQIYLANSARNMLIALLPPLLSVAIANKSDIYGVSDTVSNGRVILSVCAGQSTSSFDSVIGYARRFALYTDYWEY